jgi:hypothetical protein
VFDPWLREQISALEARVMAETDLARRLESLVRGLLHDIAADRSGQTLTLVQALATVRPTDGYSPDLLRAANRRRRWHRPAQAGHPDPASPAAAPDAGNRHKHCPACRSGNSRTARRPMHILQHPMRRPVHRHAEIRHKPVIPRGFQIVHHQIAPDQRAFQIKRIMTCRL